LFRLWYKKRSNDWRAGVMLSERETALAIVQHRAGQLPLLKHCGIHPGEEIRPEHVLAMFIQGRQLAKAPISGIIDTDDYQIVQVEAPEVPEDELNNAVRWKLGDVLNFPAADAVIDVFEIPQSPARSQTKMISVVAARKAAVQRVADLVAPRAPGFDVIDIPELCLRNLSVLLPQDAKGVALLAFGEGFAQLVLTRQGVLYLTRRIELHKSMDVRHDATSDSDAVPASSGIDAAALALQLQRSLDYYESFFDQAPITHLVLAPGDARAKQLAVELRAEVPLQIELFAAEHLFEVDASIEIDTRWPGLIALGAAARPRAGH
jgi:MSHA biogenesis protein MshI